MRPIDLALVIALVISSCATLSPAPAARDVDEILSAHALEVRWDQPSDACAAETREALTRPLNEESTVAIALANNLELRAHFEELGIAQADLAGALLLPNPVLGGSVRFPISSSNEASRPKLEGSVVFSVLHLLMIPAKSGAAEARLERTKLDVARAVLDFSAEVRTAFLYVEGGQALLRLERDVAEASDLAAEFAERQHAAGTLSELNLSLERIAQQQAHLDLARRKVELTASRERLHQLLGIDAPLWAWSITSSVSAIPKQEVSLEDLERMALNRRLDLAALKIEILANEKERNVARWSRFPEIRAGMSAEREPDGLLVVGPQVDLELPIFNWNQAEVARADSRIRQTMDLYEAHARIIRSEVRTAEQRLRAARELADYYEGSIVPLRTQAVREAQRHYNGMTLGLYDLLRIVRADVEARRELIGARREYWLSRVELERAVGARLIADRPPPSTRTLELEPFGPVEVPASQPSTQPSTQPAAPHHHDGGQGAP